MSQLSRYKHNKLEYNHYAYLNCFVNPLNRNVIVNADCQTKRKAKNGERHDQFQFPEVSSWAYI